MPKIFKENKFVLFLANVITIIIWIFIFTAFKNIFLNDNLPFYLYKIADLIRFVPPIWLTYYLWILRKI
tara:strand:+ start:247 stop:453 length:207 start_codon:yes stop_codon:yes gene_type:complete